MMECEAVKMKCEECENWLLCKWSEEWSERMSVRME
jgi:hypothetical protein